MGINFPTICVLLLLCIASVAQLNNTVLQLPSASLTLANGKFVLDGVPQTPAEKQRLAKLYISLHVELHRVGVLPRPGVFSYAVKHNGVFKHHVLSLPRSSIAKFMARVKKLAPPNSRCLEWGPGYIVQMPGCTSHWDFQYDSKQPRVDATGRKMFGAVDEPFPSQLESMKGYFNVIVCTQVYEHLRHPTVAAANLYTLLAPGGLVIWSAPFLEPEHKVPEDHYRYTLEGAEHLMHHAGFVTNISFVGGNAMLSSARMAGFTEKDFTPAQLEDMLVEGPFYMKKYIATTHRQMYWGTYIVFQKPRTAS